MTQHPQTIIVEIERQGGTIRAGHGELLVELPPELRNSAWMGLLRREKAPLMEWLTQPRIDTADAADHRRFLEQQTSTPKSL